MVTLKNNFGVEPDKESVVMNVVEAPGNDAKSVNGHPKAILICRGNSHPFQARTLILNTPAKIGRSVARARPSSYNGIFDCKVLSRNHAIIWYEYDSGKFMIQDTKSSNGTFVNNERLSKGGETSLPREFFSRDVVQFGVDVLENQRKGNEESENSDESNHIVTHGCIVATVRLFHPNGKESKSGQTYSTQSTMTPIPQEKICKLELIIHEAQQREGRLHDKLEELQLIIGKLEVACKEALTNRFEETRLLSKIENLEKQAKVMNKVMCGSTGKSSEKGEAEIRQLLVDIENVQNVARDIQERQHRKLLESEHKLVEAQRVATNLELEVIGLREQASLTELHLQEMGAKCTAYCQTIDMLKSNYQAQMELTQKLEAQLAKFEEKDGERDIKSTFAEQNILGKLKCIVEKSNEDSFKKENSETITEWKKNYSDLEKTEEKEFLNEDNKTEWIDKKSDNITRAICRGLERLSCCIGELEEALMDVEISKATIEKLYNRKHELSLELESVKTPVKNEEKTENDIEGDKLELVKSLILSSVSNEKITEIETKLTEQEELLSQARLKQIEFEGKCSSLRLEIDGNIKGCAKLLEESCNLKQLLKNYLRSLEISENMYRQKVVKLESEIEELDNGQEQKLLEILGNICKSTEIKETQTESVTFVSSSSNTDFPSNVSQENEAVEEKIEKVQCNDSIKTNEILLKKKLSSLDEVDNKREENKDLENLMFSLSDESSLTKTDVIVNKNELNIVNDNNPESEWSSNNLGIWEKIQKIQSFLSNQSTKDSFASSNYLNEVKSLMNLLTEDIVHLLLREQQVSKDKQCLETKLNKSLYDGESSSNVGFAMHFWTIIVFFVTILTAYFIYTIL